MANLCSKASFKDHLIKPNRVSPTGKHKHNIKEQNKLNKGSKSSSRRQVRSYQDRQQLRQANHHSWGKLDPTHRMFNRGRIGKHYRHHKLRHKLRGKRNPKGKHKDKSKQI